MIKRTFLCSSLSLLLRFALDVCMYVCMYVLSAIFGKYSVYFLCIFLVCARLLLRVPTFIHCILAASCIDGWVDGWSFGIVR